MCSLFPWLQVGYIDTVIEEVSFQDRHRKLQDPRLKVGFPETIFNMLFKLAQSCVSDKKKDRPLMVDVCEAFISSVFVFNI